MIASLQVLVPPLAVVLFLAFLVLLAVLAKIAGAATRGSKDGPRGCLGGCGLVAVVLLLCTLAIAGFVAFVATLAGVAAVEHNPIRSIDILVPDGSPFPDTEHGEYPHLRDGEVPVVVRIRADGDASDLERRVRRLLERRFDVDDVDLRHLRTTRGPDETRIDLWFPMRQRDVHELRRELDAWGVDLGDGVRITLEEGRGV